MIRLFHPTQLGKKLITALIIFSSVITLVTTSVQLWSEYGQDVEAIKERFVQIEQGYLDSVAENVWQIDTDRLQLLVTGIIRAPDFRYAAVRDADGQVMAKAGQDVSDRIIRKVYPLTYSQDEAAHQIGNLEVIASLSGVYHRTFNRFGLILLSNAVKTFFVALFMFAMVYWGLALPLNAIAQKVRDLDFTGKAELLKVDRKLLGGRSDEMDMLVETVNDMQGKLFAELTARKEAEEELKRIHAELERKVELRTRSLSDEIVARQETEAELRKVTRAVEQSTNMIFITDTKGTIEYVNHRFTEMTGYTEKEAIGQTSRLLKSGRTPKEVYEDLWETLLTGNEWRGELQDRRKDGSLYWASVSIAPVQDETGEVTHFVSMHEDITVRKEAEKAMWEARNAAEIANKAKTDLLANMSHELRTPLNAIIGFSEAMQSQIFGPLGNPQYVDYTNYIQSSGAHLLQLINDILDVSALETGKLRLREQLVDVGEICEASMRIVQPKALDNLIAISSLNGVVLPRLNADPLRLKQILINLLSNAVKFTPKGGEISCDAFVDDDGKMVITVTDTGIGMDQEEIAVAFAKFGQVDSSLSRSQEGTGLGLPLTKGLVELHGGEMDLESEKGKGTRVIIRFPSERTGT